MTSLIVQDESAFGPLVFMMRQLESLGGTSSIPYDRVQNFFRYAGSVATTKGNPPALVGLRGHSRAAQWNREFRASRHDHVQFGLRTRHDHEPATGDAEQNHTVNRDAPSGLSAVADAVLCRRHMERPSGTSR